MPRATRPGPDRGSWSRAEVWSRVPEIETTRNGLGRLRRRQVESTGPPTLSRSHAVRRGSSTDGHLLPGAGGALRTTARSTFTPCTWTWGRLLAAPRDVTACGSQEGAGGARKRTSCGVVPAAVRGPGPSPAHPGYPAGPDLRLELHAVVDGSCHGCLAGCPCPQTSRRGDTQHQHGKSRRRPYQHPTSLGAYPHLPIWARHQQQRHRRGEQLPPATVTSPDRRSRC